MSESPEPQLHYITNDSFLGMVHALSRSIADGGWTPDFVVGIGRGGLVPAVYISHETQIPMLSIDHSSKVPGFADELLGKVAAKSTQNTRLLFIDDINDSGGTIIYIRKLLSENGGDGANLRFAVLINNQRSQTGVDYWAESIDRDEDKRWFVFPWEAVGARNSIVEEALSVPERLG